MTLEQLNGPDKQALGEALAGCCGSRTWVKKMMAVFPVMSVHDLLRAASRCWHACGEEDWKEAFGHHPKIGDLETLKKKFGGTGPSMEQAGALEASVRTLQAFEEGNRMYEEKFGYIFIVCATGKSAEEMLRLLLERMNNDPKKEILIAMGEQEKIMRLRLEKLLS